MRSSTAARTSGATRVSGTPSGFAVAWSRALAEAGCDWPDSATLRGPLSRMADEVCAAPPEREACRDIGAAVGHELVEMHFTLSEAVAATVLTFDTHLPPRITGAQRAALYAGLAEGYADALRERARGEQERIARATLDAYHTSEARLRAVFRSTALGVVIADRFGRILEANQRLGAMLGLDAAGLTGLDIRILKSVGDPPEHAAAYDDLLSGRAAHYSAEKRFVRDDDSTVWTRAQADVVRRADGSVELLIEVFEDISERRELTRRLQYQATHDPLTGLPNRTRLHDRLADVLHEAGPAERIGLCFLDLDGFKAVNDTLGHAFGDRLLEAVARRLRAAADPHGQLIARMGGDEFVILVPDTRGTASMTRVADSVLAALAEPFELDGHRLTVSASLGLVERQAAGAEPTELLRAADMSMYWAKADGKARWRLFDPRRDAAEIARHALSRALPGAIERGELFLEYQPIVDLAGGGVQAMEALVRWNHPVLGLLGPDRFVPVAEESGSIVALGRWVLRRAVLDAATWPKTRDGRPLAVAVNVAVRQIREPGLRDDLILALDAAGLGAERLHLEITETAVMESGEQGRPALETLRALSALGARIVIDDFGTGYSNLAYLHRLPAHALKIDASFVAALPTSGGPGRETGEAIVNSLISVAHACGMTVTAEGVETRTQAARLRRLGAEAAQGYYFSRPVANEQIPELTAELSAASTGNF